MIGKLLVLLLFSTHLFGGWAEKTLETMTLEEKIGQLFVIPACPLREEKHVSDLFQTLERFHVGGIIPKQGTVASHVALVNLLQERSKYPLLCLADAEWGLSMRLKDVMRFPKNLTLGAMQDLTLLNRLGRAIGEQCREIGIHINLAPVVDILSSPNNRIIQMRSFGDNPAEVAARATAWMHGLQAGGTLACAKHFPGHGDTTVDSHDDLPVLKHSLERLESVELIPFYKMIDEKVACIMPGHLAVPALEPLNRPASLSSAITRDLLQRKMGFQGLVISDALNMQACSRHFTCEEIALYAFLAGNDLLLYGDHIAPKVDAILLDEIPRAFQALLDVVNQGVIKQEELDARVLKILKVKEALHLDQKRTVSTPEVDTFERIALKKELYRAAITLASDKKRLLPIPLGSTIALLRNSEDPALISALEKYGKVTASGEIRIAALYGALDADTVKRYVTEENIEIVILFGTPYNLELIPPGTTVIVAYEQDPDASLAASDLIFGQLAPQGKLPVSIGTKKLPQRKM